MNTELLVFLSDAVITIAAAGTFVYCGIKAGLVGGKPSDSDTGIQNIIKGNVNETAQQEKIMENIKAQEQLKEEAREKLLKAQEAAKIEAAKRFEEFDKNFERGK